MRASAIVREAWRNVATGTGRSLTFALLLAALTLVVAVADMFSVRQLLDSAKRFNTSGATVLVLTADGQIVGERCDKLVELEGVRAAGAIRATTQPLVAAVLPTAPLPVSESTPGFTRMLGLPSPSPGVLLGPEAARTFGIHSTGTIATHAGTAQVGGTYSYPDDGRRPGLSYAAVAPSSSSDPFDECWVDSWPANPDVSSALLTTLQLSNSGESGRPSVSQLNPSLGVKFDGKGSFDERATRWAGVVAALGGLGLGLVGARSRRLQLASALHAGVSHAALFAILTVESVFWILASAALSVSVGCLFAIGMDGSLSTLFPMGVVAQLPAWIGALAGVWAGLTLTRERHLFRYFKDR